MDKESILFTMPLHRLEPIFKSWFKEVLSDNQIESESDYKSLINTDQLMKKLGVTRPTIQKWRDEGRIPFAQEGHIIRYDIDEVIEALAKKK